MLLLFNMEVFKHANNRIILYNISYVNRQYQADSIGKLCLGCK